ncbi:hypothetical protein NC651_005431 [Populus alba x Populus x berolinensis]|nr:hypothetical protein NC651_005431 [Populus alba x Populus x berolinensis]
MNLLIYYVLPWRKKRAADGRPQGVLFKIGNEERYAASELASLPDEIIRPVIEEHVRDSQDNVATTVAEKWMQKTVEQAQPAEEPGNDDEVSCLARILNIDICLCSNGKDGPRQILKKQNASVCIETQNPRARIEGYA